MSIENIPDGDVYNGDFEEKLEKRFYKCFGTLEIEIYEYSRLLEALGLRKSDLYYEDVTVSIELVEFIQAWDKRQADDMWDNIMEHKENNADEMLAHSGIRGTVKRKSEDSKVRRKSKL
jgi:hypothetical protein